MTLNDFPMIAEEEPVSPWWPSSVYDVQGATIWLQMRYANMWDKNLKLISPRSLSRLVLDF